MCGILWDTTKSQPDREIGHRGIRSHRSVTPDGVLTHVRLPIVDLSLDSDQPFEDERWVFAFVGELFNYKDFYSKEKSDSRAMFNLWRTNQTSLMAIMDGFWAIVAYNKWSQQTHVVTDFLAKKPLYYHLPTGNICSEIKPLLCHGKTTFDEYYFSTVRKFGYCMNEHTFVNEVIKIPANAHWVISRTEPIKKLVCSRPLCPTNPAFIRSSIEKSVKDRVKADVPISILLSGGLDSTIVFELMK